MPTSFEEHTAEDDLVEVLDDQGQPFMVVSLKHARRQKLCYRAVIVLFYDREGLLYLQKRSKHSALYPELWDVAASYVAANESGQDAALRCLYSMLGVKSTHCVCKTVTHKPAEFSNLNIAIFHASAPACTPSPDSKEVDSLISVTKTELDMLLRDFPDQVSPILKFAAGQGLIFS